MDLQNQPGDGCIVGALDVSGKAAFDEAMSDFAGQIQNRLDVMFNTGRYRSRSYCSNEPPFGVAPRSAIAEAWPTSTDPFIWVRSVG